MRTWVLRTREDFPLGLRKRGILAIIRIDTELALIVIQSLLEARTRVMGTLIDPLHLRASYSVFGSLWTPWYL